MESIQTLHMQGVTRRFGSTTALENFHLEIGGGMFVTLLGPSGCGKTTALNCLAGLLDLSAGEILLNSRPMQNVPAEKRGFGMVFQNYALFPHLTVFRNVSYGLEIRKVPRAERIRRVNRALAQVHLQGFEKRYPAQLSGGQQQRLAIARTIVLEPALLLLDEPLSNLDANLRNEMRIEIKRIHNELGLTTVYVTHDQMEAMSLSDRIVVMRQGTIEQVGTPQEIYHHPHSLYVARFMGYANRLSVELLGREGDRWSVRAPNGAILQATTTVPKRLSELVGQHVIASFRPDDTLVTTEPASNRLTGRVRLAEYMGKSFEALVYLEGTEETQLLVHSPQALGQESLVEFSVSPAHLLLFPDAKGDDSAIAPQAEAVAETVPAQVVPQLEGM